MPLLTLFTLVHMSSPTHASLTEAFHRVTCNALLRPRPTPAENDRLKKWLEAQTARAEGPVLEIEFSARQDEPRWERQIHRSNELARKKIYAAFEKGRVIYPGLIAKGFSWEVSFKPQGWFLSDQDITLIPFGDRFTWSVGDSAPSGGEFFIFVIEHCRYSGNAPYMSGQYEDPLPALIARAKSDTPGAFRVERVTSEDTYHGTRASILRLVSDAPMAERLHQLLEFDRILKQDILKYPTNEEMRRLFSR